MVSPTLSFRLPEPLPLQPDLPFQPGSLWNHHPLFLPLYCAYLFFTSQNKVKNGYFEGRINITALPSECFAFFHVYFDKKIASKMPFPDKPQIHIIVDTFGYFYLFCFGFCLFTMPPAGGTEMLDNFALSSAIVAVTLHPHDSFLLGFDAGALAGFAVGHGGAGFHA